MDVGLDIAKYHSANLCKLYDSLVAGVNFTQNLRHVYARRTYTKFRE